ncbi:MAG: DoxX family protein [Candidatus Pacebacteria bacterium]|jgi:putative oxidoreductase|nr:DoxX family protein [Candidatus Paceibacterota bacterium]
MKKINYALVSRSFFALLFVFAGIGKIMGFSTFASSLGQMGLPMPMLAAIIVIIIEVPVALAFAYGYKIKETGYALIAFTVLATLIAHNDFSNQMNVIMSLKNLAIVGGLMSAIACSCATCVVHGKKHHAA